MALRRRHFCGRGGVRGVHRLRGWRTRILRTVRVEVHSAVSDMQAVFVSLPRGYHERALRLTLRRLSLLSEHHHMTERAR